MPTLDEIRKQIKALPHGYVFYTRKEIRYLPKILNEGEKVLAITSGYMNKHTWLAVCTNKRVLFLDRGMFFGLRQVQMNLDRIQSIDSSYTILFGRIRMWDGASSISIGLVLKSSIGPFVRTVQDAIDTYKRTMAYDIANSITGTGSNTGTPKLTDELERLAKLKAEGHLSEEEFQAAKTKLISGN